MEISIRERAKNIFGSENKTPDKTTMVQDKGNSQVDSAILESKEKLRNRKKSGFRSTSEESTKTEIKTPEQIGAELSALLQPTVWKPIVNAPANLMLAVTNHAHWEVPDKESEPLAITCATAMQYAAIRSPGLLALSLFLIHATVVYLPRTVMELQLRKQEKIAREKKAASTIKNENN